jgi:hypothetical protein
VRVIIDFDNLSVKPFLPFLIPFSVACLIVFALTRYGCDSAERAHAKKELPFSHKTHTSIYKLPCSRCHSLNQNGTFSGIPDVGSCRSCHNGTQASEKAFFAGLADDYRPWEAFCRQPDFVFFSHAAVIAHADKKEECAPCHGDKADTMTTAQTQGKMSMGKCMKCHSALSISNRCTVCHK